MKILFLLFLAMSGNTFSQTHTPITTPISPNIQGYYEYLPADYATSNKTYPLLVFFHGKAERGNGSQTDLQLILTYGPPKEIADGVFPKTINVGGKDFSFIVISPQLQNTAIETAQDYNILMNYIKSHYRIDESRIYLTGLSLGAGRILYTAASSVNTGKSIAAMVAASTDWSEDSVLSPNVGAANVPLWLATNTDDPTVPYTYTVWWYNYLSAYTPAMNPQPLLDTFGVKGHDSWTKLFDPTFRPRGVNVYEWLLQYTRGTDTATRHVYPYVSVPDTVTVPIGSVTLDGSASSTDSGALIISYKWQVLSGPSGYQLNNSTASIATLTNLLPGKYTVQLTISNNKGVSGTSNAVIVAVKGQKPLAVIQGPASITLPVDSVTLNGSSSYDLDGNISSYNWTCIYGAAGYVLSGATSSIAKITKLSAGLYSFVLSVTNSNGFADTDTINVVVKNATVTGPVILVKTPALVTAPSVTLDATNSYTTAGSTIASWGWKYISGPKGATYTDSSKPVITYSNLKNGTYVYNLHVTDSKKKYADLRVTFTVNLAASKVYPIILTQNAITLPVNSVSLNGSTSYTDNGATIASYNWKVVTGALGYQLANNTSSVATLSNLSAGNYLVRLTVTNNKGVADSTTATIVVSQATVTKPVAIIQAPASITLPVDSVMLDGSTSYSTGGSISSYAWKVLSGAAGYQLMNNTSSIAKFLHLSVGNYVVQLNVINDKGIADSTTATIVVSQPTVVSPVAIIQAPGSITLPVDSIMLDGSNSYSTGGTISSYNWTCVTSLTGYVLSSTTDAVIKASKLVAGNYSFILTVRNNSGLVASDTVSLVVNPAVTGPVVVIKPIGTVTTTSVTLDATGSYTTPGSTIVAWTWKYISGPKGATYTDSSKPVITFSNLKNGTYTYNLRIADSKKKYVDQRVSFTVSLAAGQRSIAALGNRDQIAIFANGAEANNFLAQPLRLAPVPAKDYVHLSISNSAKGKVTIRVTDISGKPVLLQNGAYKEFFKWEDRLNVSRLMSGLYYVELFIGGERFENKFVKTTN